MRPVHSGLQGTTFTAPNTITRASICKDSGLLASELCSKDERGSRVYSELFVKGTVPSKTCDCHVKATVCKETGKIATEYCKEKEEKIFISRPNSDKDKGWEKARDAKYMVPTDECDKHTKPKDTTKPEIKLVGDATINVLLKAKYEDKGATAKDDTDGDLTKKIEKVIILDGKVVEKIDTSKVGTYTITYKVKDEAGNEATATRKVVVKEKLDDDKNNITNTTNTITNTTTNTNTTPTTNTTTVPTSTNTVTPTNTVDNKKPTT